MRDTEPATENDYGRKGRRPPQWARPACPGPLHVICGLALLLAAALAVRLAVIALGNAPDSGPFSGAPASLRDSYDAVRGEPSNPYA
jgi:hypothetical protein